MNPRRITTKMMTGVSIGRFGRMRSVIDLSPPYQREGGVWSPQTRENLIDSIINGLDIPKLYFEEENSGRKNAKGLTYQYAVIDGKQRLETILAFLEGDLALSENFIFFEDESIDATEMRISELRKTYPHLYDRFVDFELPIVRVTTNSGDLIEEMFQRLNASTALNAAERRNALKGPTRDAANTLAEHDLLVRCSPIKNARYKYRELGAKFLAIEHQLDTNNRITDTKADRLYALFIATRAPSPSISPERMSDYAQSATETLDRMSTIFDAEDALLASIGTVVVYYICFRDQEFYRTVNREMLTDFELARRSVAQLSEMSDSYSTAANARLREYNGLVQSTNDGSALSRRAQILTSYVLGYSEGAPLAGLESIQDGELPQLDESEDA
ncbi:Protein of unknown function DUF262 [Tsukamurella pulmonis]|uniref:GmrSD restriction endonucleases N-terminal domain-containing protein n=1 Tax=Tsukamurella pulmonis TaxID=47312 RepID=A0A1H1DQ83_9ACTN|nr:DUF262 domain-containing protein [Tsukamurella pulmonis]SDQ78665.1 Protein of unknown function DUF262 [Tsukamurella pulmonis]SUP21806.1 Protein of uncharacterised function DUF262 [Tsukamurella pulmonis]